MLSAYTPPARIYRLRPGARVDSDGDTVHDWSSPVRWEIPLAKVQARSASEAETPSSAQYREQRVLRVQAAIDLRATDRVEVDGVVYDIEGDPVVRRGFALGPETTAFLVRTEGRRT